MSTGETAWFRGEGGGGGGRGGRRRPRDVTIRSFQCHGLLFPLPGENRRLSVRKETHSSRTKRAPGLGTRRIESDGVRGGLLHYPAPHREGRTSRAPSPSPPAWLSPREVF